MRSQVLDEKLKEIDASLLIPFSHKTIVVTGATGLIGSLMCKALLIAQARGDLECRIVAVVRDKDKADSILGDYLPLGSLSYVVEDLSSGASLNIDEVDFILHAASVTKSRTMVEHPVDVINTSFRGTECMLDLAHRRNARMVFISSMEAAGTLPKGKLADEGALGWLDLTSPRTCYPESKRLCECLCAAYASQYSVQACSARLAQTLGAGVLPGENRAFAQFARSALKAEDIVLKTQGRSEGNYVNTIDCLQALLVLLAQGEPGQIYNVANEDAHGTIRQVAQLASDALSAGKAKVVVNEDPFNTAGYAPDVHLKLSSAKLRSLGWNPEVSLWDSFVQLGAYLREQEDF